jgi:hypothetical protein
MQIQTISTMLHFCSQQSPQEKWNKKGGKGKINSRKETEKALENMRKKTHAQKREWKKKFAMRGVLECNMQQKETLTPRAGKKVGTLKF